MNNRSEKCNTISIKNEKKKSHTKEISIHVHILFLCWTFNMLYYVIVINIVCLYIPTRHRHTTLLNGSCIHKCKQYPSLFVYFFFLFYTHCKSGVAHKIIKETFRVFSSIAFNFKEIANCVTTWNNRYCKSEWFIFVLYVANETVHHLTEPSHTFYVRLLIIWCAIDAKHAHFSKSNNLYAMQYIMYVLSINQH